MVRDLICTYRASSIYSLKPSLFSKLGFKYLFIDLDNTLVQYDVMIPPKKVFLYLEELRKEGIEVIIVSNNVYKRVSAFCSRLDVNYIYRTNKPSPKKVIRYLKSHSIDVNKCLYIGDQVINDMILARKAKMRSLLTEPISKKDHISTRFIRMIDYRLRSYYLKKGRLGISLEEQED
ncbi:MAG: HAD-IIIA family hydrolase [Bacilli bacterium]|nr:HAD-IIIA family hydrolase [Bacilli bacterium]